MKFNLPSQLRIALYIITALGTPIIGYLFTEGHIGETEVTLWGGLVTAVTSMATLNVKPTEEVKG